MKGKQYFNLSALALAIILVWSTCHLVSLQKNESDNIDTEVKHIIQTYIRKHRDKKSFTILTTAKINEDKYAPNTILLIGPSYCGLFGNDETSIKYSYPSLFCSLEGCHKFEESPADNLKDRVEREYNYKLYQEAFTEKNKNKECDCKINPRKQFMSEAMAFQISSSNKNARIISWRVDTLLLPREVKFNPSYK